MGVKLGNLDVSFKLGSGDCTVYLGETLIYSPTPPAPKWIATYTGGTTSSAECDGSSAITQNEITLTNLVSVEIMDCVTSIGSSAFRNCSGLTSIDIPSGVTTIGERAFENCSGLTEVTIPDSVTSISGIAFNKCYSLTSVTIGSGVTTIGSYAFRNCSGLTSLTIYATTPPSLGTFTLAKTNDCPIYVPAESVSAYQTAWTDYASRIQAIPTPSPQWVTFNSGDDISGLNVYGVKGVAKDLGATFGDPAYNIYFLPDRNNFECLITSGIQYCYYELYNMNDSVELIFSNVSCDDYYTLPASITAGGTIQLYIYQ